MYLDNTMSDISKFYAKSRSNGQRNGEEARGLESTWKQKTRDTAPAWYDIRLKDSTHDELPRSSDKMAGWRRLTQASV
jgi:hypothetical protein